MLIHRRHKLYFQVLCEILWLKLFKLLDLPGQIICIVRKESVQWIIYSGYLLVLSLNSSPVRQTVRCIVTAGAVINYCSIGFLKMQFCGLAASPVTQPGPPHIKNGALPQYLSNHETGLTAGWPIPRRQFTNAQRKDRAWVRFLTTIFYSTLVWFCRFLLPWT